MIPEFIKLWENNKHKLENYFKITKQEEYDDYSKIVKKLFELVINDSQDAGTARYNFRTDKLTIIDHGEYQGTELFILFDDTYQPDVSDYVMTHNYYGSCSGCDTLLSIISYDELPTADQVKNYMLIALHLIQNCKWLS